MFSSQPCFYPFYRFIPTSFYRNFFHLVSYCKGCVIFFSATSLYLVKKLLDISSAKQPCIFLFSQSYCPKHTSLRKTPTRSCNMKKDCKTASSKLYKVQESFHRFANPQMLVTELQISLQLSQLLFNYWKLKRRVRTHL